MRAATDLRARLRAATEAVHQRTHLHPGLAAAASGKIERADYIRLLQRLYGFHLAFEKAHERVGSEEDRARSHLIAEDLKTLGVDRDTIARLPLCECLKPPRDEAERLGALYVLEGSTMGGVQIARALRAVIDEPDGAGRRFFLGYGDRHGAMWRAFLARLEQLAEDPEQTERATLAAIDAFEQFELWMKDWNVLYLHPAHSRPEFAQAGAT